MYDDMFDTITLSTLGIPNKCYRLFIEQIFDQFKVFTYKLNRQRYT